MERSRTCIAIPPGATIKEMLVDRGMNQKEFAIRMDMSEKHISRLINGEVILTTDVAMRLEMVLGVPARFWSNLESIYREDLLRVQAENEMDEDILVVKKFPYMEMESIGWIESNSRDVDRVVSLRKFFEVVRLAKYREALMPSIVRRRLTDMKQTDYSLMAWIQKARIEARHVETGALNLKKLEAILPEIRKMTVQTPDIFCGVLCEMFSNCGIALVFLPSIGELVLDGATFQEKNRIVIGITMSGKDSEEFWFSLFHEVGHVLCGHVDSVNGTTEEDEEEADRFAREILIPEVEMELFKENREINEAVITAFAQKLGINTGIVVGRLQKDGLVKYNSFNQLKEHYNFSA